MTVQRIQPGLIRPCFLQWMAAAGLWIACSVSSAHAEAGPNPNLQPIDLNPKVNDVLGALARVPETPREVPCQRGDFTLPAGGHLQGIQQATIAGKPFAVISGSSNAESYLMLIALEGAAGRVSALRPLLPRPFKHAGGFQICGDYLAVGIEDNDAKDASRIWILKVSQLAGVARPKPVIEIERHGTYKRATAGAVGMAKVQSKHVLCVGTWDSATIDIYVSNGRLLDDPGCEFRLRATWDAAVADRSSWSDRHVAAYQNINLLVDESDRLFLIGLARAKAGDVADLFELKLDLSTPATGRLRKRYRHVLQGRRTSFQAGAGLVIADTHTLTLLACAHRDLVIERFDHR